MSEKEEKKKSRSSKLYFERPYFSPIGWTLLAVCVPITIVVFLMLNGVINDAGFLLMGLHIAIWVLTAVLYLVNILYYGPGFATRLTGKNRKGPLDEYDCKGELPDEDVKRERLLNYENDQWLLRAVWVSVTFVIIFLGVYMGQNGGIVAYQPLPAVPTNADFQNFVVYKIYQAITLGIFSGAFIILMYTGSDFLARQLTAMNAHHMEEHNDQLPATQRFAMRGVNVLADHDD